MEDDTEWDTSSEEQEEGPPIPVPYDLRHLIATNAVVVRREGNEQVLYVPTPGGGEVAAGLFMEDGSTDADDEEEDEDDDHTHDDEPSVGRGTYNADGEYEPSEQEIHEYCLWLGLDPEAERELTWIAREALCAPLPEHWKVCRTEDEQDVYYFNVRTGESIWDHPMDAFFKALYRQEKANLLQKRRHMRQFSTSLPIQPVADFFSDFCEEGAIGDEAEADGFGLKIPESLIDPIDFRIFVDPVLLATSGRTVSRRTIIGMKWRDPFTREYVQERRMFPNVDKRREGTQWLQAATERYVKTVVACTTDGVAALLRITPWLLDKEDEVCVRTQQLLLAWVKRHCTLVPSPPPPPAQSTASPRDAPISARQRAGAGQKPPKVSPRGFNTGTTRRGTGRDERRRSSAVPPLPLPRTEPELVALLLAHPEPEQDDFVKALLTMSTAAAREMLLVLLTAAPGLAQLPGFAAFNDEILNALHLSCPDLKLLADRLSADAALAAKEAKARLPPAVPATPTAPDVAPTTPQRTDSPHRLTSTPSGQGPAERSPQAAGAAFSDVGLPPRRGSAPTSDPPSAVKEELTPPGAPQPPTGPRPAQSPRTKTRSRLVARKEDDLLQLQWLPLIVSRCPTAAPLRECPFAVALQLVLTLHATPSLGAEPAALIQLLQGNAEWPAAAATCSDAAVELLLDVAVTAARAAVGAAPSDAKDAAKDTARSRGRSCDTGRSGGVGSRSHSTTRAPSVTATPRTTSPAPAALASSVQPVVAFVSDLLLKGGERGVARLKSDADAASALRTAVLVAAAGTDEFRCGRAVPEDDDDDAGHVCLVSGSDTAGAAAGVARLGALLVFHGVLALPDLAATPGAVVRVGFNLLPRLTRSQWRPRTFEATVRALQHAVDTHRILAWRFMNGPAVLYLLRELSRKKSKSTRDDPAPPTPVRGDQTPPRAPTDRNASGRSFRRGSLLATVEPQRADSISEMEATERRLEQSAAVTNWGLLGAGLLRRAAQAEVEAAPCDGVDRRTSLPPIGKGGTGAAPPRAPRCNHGRCRRLAAFAQHHAACSERRLTLAADRAANLGIALSLLLSLRLRKKAHAAELAKTLARSGKADTDISPSKAMPRTPPRADRGGPPSRGTLTSLKADPRRESQCPSLPPLARR